jgi:hypothetical protein
MSSYGLIKKLATIIQQSLVIWQQGMGANPNIWWYKKL